jgi:hypothetical protein
VKHSLKLAVALFIGISGCGSDEGPAYNLFNCEDDFTLIYVGIPEVWTDDACDGVDTIELRSSSCELPGNENANLVGTADISPCGGPIGTQHQIVVRVNSLYKDQVDRVSVRLNSGERGEDEYDMNPDSADEGLYKLTLESVGSAGELRNDTIHIKLWEEI